MATPAYARLVFTTDLFTNEAEIFRIGDTVNTTDGTTDLILEFGSLMTESLKWDAGVGRFEFSNKLHILSGLSATGVVDFSNTSQFRLREAAFIATSGPDAPDCTNINELAVDTNTTKLYICTDSATDTWVLVGDGNDGGEGGTIGGDIGGLLGTISTATINTDQIDVYANNGTWGGLIIPASDTDITALKAWITQYGSSGDLQGAIYNADSNARVAITAPSTVTSNGIKTMTFSSPVTLTKGQPYYLAISCTANASRFAGRVISSGNFNYWPKPSFKNLNARLPATLNDISFDQNLVWIGAEIE
jgi:hypothetical protein